MTRPTRTAAALLLSGSLVAVLAACGTQVEPEAATTPTSAAPTTAAPTTAAPTPGATTGAPVVTPPSTPASPTADQTVSISVADGTVTPKAGRVKVVKGSTVAIVVTSDVAEEVHLHGYDKSIDLEAGRPGTLTFKANLAGVFEVELEESHKQLTQLQVS